MASVLSGSVVEESCFQSTIRNKSILNLNISCQTLGVLAGATAAVAGFYFSTINSGWSSYLFGGSGAIFSTYSLCGLSYLIDYKKIISEFRKIKTLEQAKSELEQQVLYLEGVERGITSESKEIEKEVSSLKEQVERFSSHITCLKNQLSKANEHTEVWVDVADKIKDEEEKIAGHIQSFSSEMTSAYSLHAQNHKHRLEVIGSLENLEARLESKERSIIELMSKKDDLLKFLKLKEGLETFKFESPQEYENLLDRYSFLRI